MPESPSNSRAVFLSYAREDAEPARRVADALRAFGVEVWFDQNELRGGDAWDQKLRNQIKDCALFLPIVSAATQARAEGYFRREWRLAVDRTHDMAAGVAFILPLVIDETTEAEAHVPDEFMRFQWTRLPHGVPSPEFVGHVKLILDNPRLPAAKSRPGATSPAHGATNDSSGGKKSGRSPALWVVAGIVLVVLAGLIFRPRRSPQEAAELIAAAKLLGESAAAKTAAETKPAPAEPAAPAAAKIEAKSIAVLPFENMSEDKDANAFFADGVHEDILTNLSFIRDLHVISRTSVMQYRNTTKPIKEIARELGVAYILEGSVRRAGNKVRVTGQLIRAATDEHVWAKAYDRDVTDVFALQAELAQAIAGSLQSVIEPEAKVLLERKPTTVPAAFDAYLKARELENRNSFNGEEGVIALYQQAVQLDPNFAAAWAEMASRHAFAYFNRDRSAERLEQAKTAIETAIHLAPDDPSVIEGLGDYYYYGYRDYARASEQYQKLAQLRPNDSTVFSSLAYIDRRLGRIPETIANFRRAFELDPGGVRIRDEFANTLLNTRHYDECLAFVRGVSAKHPDDLALANTAVLAELAAHGSTEAIKVFVGLKVAPEEQSEFVYFRQGLARVTGDWAEAIRIDREQRYFDGDVDSPRWMQDVLAAATLGEAGDLAGARSRASDAVAVMNAELARQPDSPYLWSSLALGRALTGDHDGAVQAAEKAKALLPVEKDAVQGGTVAALAASALAWAGEKDRALAEFEHLLHVPYACNSVLDRGMYMASWKPLRDDPRFQALLKDPKNNEPFN